MLVSDIMKSEHVVIKDFTESQWENLSKIFSSIDQDDDSSPVEFNCYTLNDLTEIHQFSCDEVSKFELLIGYEKRPGNATGTMVINKHTLNYLTSATEDPKELIKHADYDYARALDFLGILFCIRKGIEFWTKEYDI